MERLKAENDELRKGGGVAAAAVTPVGREAEVAENEFVDASEGVGEEKSVEPAVASEHMAVSPNNDEFVVKCVEEKLLNRAADHVETVSEDLSMIILFSERT